MTIQPLSQGVPLKCHQRHTAVVLAQPGHTSTFATEPLLLCAPSVPYPVRYLRQCQGRGDQGAHMAGYHSDDTHPIRQETVHTQSCKKAGVRSSVSVIHTHAYEYALSTASTRRTYQRTSRTRHEAGRCLQSDFDNSCGSRSVRRDRDEDGNCVHRCYRRRYVC